MSALTAPTKPLLRGLSHEVAAFGTVAAWGLLAHVASTLRGMVAAVVYGASLTALFTTSAVYHRVTLSRRGYAIIRRLDHSTIFVFIAGTYTPFCLLLGGRRGMMLLCAVWGGALLGVLRAMLWPYAPRVISAALAVAVGWIVVGVLPALYTAVGNLQLVLLMAGGLAYTAGALVYAVKWPDPVPNVFGYHEVFHALVVGAAVCHFAAVVQTVRVIQ